MAGRLRYSLCGILALAVGCTALPDTGDITPDSLLQTAQTSPESVTLGIYWATTDATDQASYEQLWHSAQEDRLPVETRRALAENGLRAGVVGGTPSSTLAKLLNPGPEATEAEQEQAALAGNAKVTGRMLQLRPGRRGEIQACETVARRVVVRRKNGQLTGREFSDAQGLYAVEVRRGEGDRVELELTPELHHGQIKRQFNSPGPGRMVQNFGRDKEVFDDLRTSVSLTSGEMLIIGSLSGATNSVGGHLHSSDSSGADRRRILMIRLSQVPASQALAHNSETMWPWK